MSAFSNKVREKIEEKTFREKKFTVITLNKFQSQHSSHFMPTERFNVIAIATLRRWRHSTV